MIKITYAVKPSFPEKLCRRVQSEFSSPSLFCASTTMICILAKPRLDDFRGISLGSSKFAASVASQSSGGLRSHGVARASVHPSIRPSVHPCIRAFVHSCIRPIVHPSINPSVHNIHIHPSNRPSIIRSSRHSSHGKMCAGECECRRVIISKCIPYSTSSKAGKEGRKTRRQEGKKARRRSKLGVFKYTWAAVT